MQDLAAPLRPCHGTVGRDWREIEMWSIVHYVGSEGDLACIVEVSRAALERRESGDG